MRGVAAHRARERGMLPPCCLPGAAPASFLEALEARPATLAALAALLMLALGPAPVSAGATVTLCTADGVRKVPLDGDTPSPDHGMIGCAHACLPRGRRHGLPGKRPR